MIESPILGSSFVGRIVDEFANKFLSEPRASARLPLLLNRSKTAADATREEAQILLQTNVGKSIVEDNEGRQKLKFTNPLFAKFIDYAREIAAHAKYVLNPLRSMIDEHLTKNSTDEKMQVLRGMLA